MLPRLAWWLGGALFATALGLFNSCSARAQHQLPLEDPTQETVDIKRVGTMPLGGLGSAYRVDRMQDGSTGAICYIVKVIGSGSMAISCLPETNR